MTHLVRQHFLHVELNGTESDGLALQSRLPDLCRDWLLPALERALERCAPADGHLCIERLDIDAGTLTIERLENDLAESVARAIEKVIGEQTPPGESAPATTAGNIQRKTTEQSLDEAFVHFLETGRLPWSFRLPPGSNLEQIIMKTWQEPAQQGHTFYAGNTIFLRALTSVSARKRLIFQFSFAFLETLLTRLSPESQKSVEQVFAVLNNAAIPPTELKVFKSGLWETTFALVATGQTITETQLLDEAWRGLPAVVAQDIALKHIIARHWPNLIPETASRQATSARTRKPTSAASPPSPDPASDAPGTGAPETTRTSYSDTTEGYYIDNAGLVLLHPFLVRFFEGLGIAADDNLLQSDRALCLLHYLATGQSVAPEYELLLPKVLCNIPLEAPVEAGLILGDAEKEETTALLEAVIRHWEALQNTSPDGLRGTFFVRPGKLSVRKDGDWLLQVEPKTFDILLSQLPWGIGMIQLPWMDRMLWVEWG